MMSTAMMDLRRVERTGYAVGSCLVCCRCTSHHVWRCTRAATVGEVPELGDAALGTTRRRVRLSRILRRAAIGGESVTTTTQQRQRMSSPMRNEAYYVLSALYCKLEGLAAYRTYAHDGNDPLWQQFSQTDNQATETLLEELEW